MSAAENAQIEGEVSPGFEPVRDAFARNFAERGESGGACCVYRNGEKIVDLWGGKRDRTTGAPWRADTMVLVYSATKHIDGQGRVLGGAILGPQWYYDDCLQPFLRHTGPACSPFNAWVLLKGLETLDLRVEPFAKVFGVVFGMPAEISDLPIVPP